MFIIRGNKIVDEGEVANYFQNMYDILLMIDKMSDSCKGGLTQSEWYLITSHVKEVLEEIDND